jgi:vacuolar-type H+-ATPase subunit B/Vma2
MDLKVTKHDMFNAYTPADFCVRDGGTSQKVITYRVFEGAKDCDVKKKITLTDGTVKEIYREKLDRFTTRIMTGYTSPINAYTYFKDNIYVHCENGKWYRLLPNNCSLKGMSNEQIENQLRGRVSYLTL